MSIFHGEVQSSSSSLSDYYVVADSNSVNFDQWSVVHELGHVWDNKNFGLLHIQLVQATGGGWGPEGGCDIDHRKPSCNNYIYDYGDFPAKGSGAYFNAREDLAESVAAYVFPSYAQAYVNQYKDNPDLKKYLYYSDYTNTKRWAFINKLINGK